MRRGWCHARRHVKVALLLACAIAASNLALLRTWAARTGNHELPYCEPDPPDHGFEELDADGNINPAPGPGTARHRLGTSPRHNLTATPPTSPTAPPWLRAERPACTTLHRAPR